MGPYSVRTLLSTGGCVIRSQTHSDTDTDNQRRLSVSILCLAAWLSVICIINIIDLIEWRDGSVVLINEQVHWVQDTRRRQLF